MWQTMLTKVVAFMVIMFSTVIQAEELKTVVISKTAVERYYHLDGIVEPVHRSTLTAQTSGQVKSVYFDVDDFVEAEQLILLLDDSEQQAGIKQARANLAAAEAGLQDAQDEYRRVKEIYAKKLVARSEVDKAEAMLNKAKAAREAAQGALEQSQQQLEYTRITAPFSGYVTARHIEVGESAQPGTPLLSGVSLDKLRVVVDVPQSLIAAIRQHQKARIQQPDGGWLMVEKLTIFPFAEQRSNTFKVRLDLPEKFQGLLPGMFVKVAFVAADESVLLVPARAVVYRSEVTGIYTLNEANEVMFRHIRVGHAVDPENLIVLSGLLENETVAVDPITAGALLKKQRQQKVDDE